MYQNEDLQNLIQAAIDFDYHKDDKNSLIRNTAYREIMQNKAKQRGQAYTLDKQSKFVKSVGLTLVFTPLRRWILC